MIHYKCGTDVEVRRKKQMKKVMSLLLIALMCCGMLVGCGKNNVAPMQSMEPATDEVDISEAEEDDESWRYDIKEDAVETNFVEIANGNWDGKHVKATGKVNVVDNDAIITLQDSFCISAKEGDGYGAYFCTNVTDKEDLKDGDIITIYGIVEKKDNPYGLDNISVYLIE